MDYVQNLDKDLNCVHVLTEDFAEEFAFGRVPMTPSQIQDNPDART